MKDKIFLDTNIWIYLISNSPKEKYLTAKEIVDHNFQNILLSTQILGELYHILTTKNFKTKNEAKEIIFDTISTFTILDIDLSKVLKAIEISSKYQYSYWDSLIIATALQTDCSILYSEDMHHEQVVENKTKIINPFK